MRSVYFAIWLISLMVKYVEDHLSTTFAALSDPTRRAILARLSLGELSVKELAEPFSITGPSVTKHLKVLERAGLISRSRDAQKRPCRFQSAPLQEVAEWVEQYRRSWEHSMNRLDEYLGQLQAEGGQKHAHRKKS
jgi:DNA-binding transcriptional ArsR family regulator